MKTVLNIQALRAAAAYGVVLYHICHAARQHGIDVSFDAGAAGVDVFFVVSGFIMVHTSSDGGKQPWDFWYRRAVRIYPIYWVVTSVLVLLSWAGFRPSGLHVWDWGDLLTSLTLLPNLRADGQPTPLLTPAWTLIYEVGFYFVFGSMLWIPGRARRVAAVCSVLSAAIAFYFWFTPASFSLQVYTNPIIAEFGAGAGLAVLYHRFRDAPGRWLAAAGGALVLLGLAGLGASAASHGDALALHHPERPLWFGLPAALLVAGALACERAQVVIRSPMVLLQGDASYSTYLVHPLVLHSLFKACGELGLLAGLVGATFTAACGLLATGFVGTALHRMVETPLARRLRREPRARPELQTPSSAGLTS